MADAIVRLKVESQEFDNKLARATQQLQHMEKECRNIGGTFEYVDKEQLDLVKSLGQMETKASSARGKVAEMTKSYTDLSMQYKRLSDQEKQSPFGKAMAQSLDQLKSRIKDANSEIKEVNQELGNGGLGGIMESLAGKIGIPIQSFTKFGAAAAGIGAALKVASDALMQNETIVDEWGRTKEAASSLYSGFLNALNTGDISGYLQNMADIVSAARDAYDAMDELQTFNAFNQINLQEAKTNWTQAIADYRSGDISREEAEKAAKALQEQMKMQQQYEQQVYESAINNMATERGVDASELKKTLAGTYGDYKAIKDIKAPTRSYETMTGTGRKYTVEEMLPKNEWSEMEKLAEMLRKLTDEELDALQKLGAQAARTGTEIASVDRTVNRMLGVGNKPKSQGGGAITSADEVFPKGSIGEIEARISELNKALKKAADTETRNEIRSQISQLKADLDMIDAGPLTGLQNAIPLEVELLDTSREKLIEDVNVLREQLGMDPIKLGVQVGGKGGDAIDTAKQTEQAWGAAANAISSIGGALQQIEDPSAKVAGIIAQAVANIALSYAQAAASPAVTSTGWGWLGFAAAGLATMIGTIASIKQVTKGGFANGGIVPGNSFSGDNLHTSDYGINSGELILNRAQQNTIASQLQGGASKIRVEGIVSGPNILLAGSNYALQTGKAVKGLNGYALPIIAG